MLERRKEGESGRDRERQRERERERRGGGSLKMPRFSVICPADCALPAF